MASENLNLVDKANEIEQNLGSREFTLGKGLLQPFNESNRFLISQFASGSFSYPA